MAVTAPAPRVLADVFPRSFARDALLVVGGAALVGIFAQISVPLPFTPVPLTGQTFAVLLVGAALGSVRGMLSMLLYGVAGVLGVPWFASGSSGFTLPSFGYIIGFIAAAGLVGWLAERGWTRNPLDTALAMVLGNVLIYAIGVTWLKFALGATWVGAIAMGMTPFLVGDGVKILIAAGLFPLLWRQMVKRGLAPRPDADAVIDLTDDADADASVAVTVADEDEDTGAAVSDGDSDEESATTTTD